MAWQCGADAAGEQGEPIGHAVEDLLRHEDTGPDRGELDGQRQAVEPADQVGHSRLVAITRRPGAALIRSATSRLAGPVRCSQLSTTNSRSESRR